MDRARAERIIEDQIMFLHSSPDLKADYWTARGFIDAYHCADFIEQDMRNHYIRRLDKVASERRQVMGALAA
ncbi:hypothetical protein [Pseudomonas sp.]|uniref:hypothetical protein n=1 Tax=Pseudomonas sp. TaxID=306 RepID=UPI00289E0E1F|nr:hypothetical protein [Pseudomonas sp.]